MVWDILLIFGVLMIVNGFFMYKQAVATDKIYTDLRRKGEMIVGQKRIFVFAVPYVVAFAIDKNECVAEALKISGILPFQRVKVVSLPYVGQKIRKLKIQDDKVDWGTQAVIQGMMKKYRYA